MEQKNARRSQLSLTCQSSTGQESNSHVSDSGSNSSPYYKPFEATQELPSFETFNFFPNRAFGVNPVTASHYDIGKENHHNEQRLAWTSQPSLTCQSNTGQESSSHVSDSGSNSNPYYTPFEATQKLPFFETSNFFQDRAFGVNNVTASHHDTSQKNNYNEPNTHLMYSYANQSGPIVNSKPTHDNLELIDVKISDDSLRFRTSGRETLPLPTKALAENRMCSISGKQFTSSGQIAHKQSHNESDRRFACDFCSQRFRYLSNLIAHKRIHSGEKPFACDLCSQRFRVSSSLRRHKRIHSGEKPFACDLCFRSFTQSGNLKEHKRIHSGEKPFACDLCSQTFTQSNGLRAHKRIHSRETRSPVISVLRVKHSDSP